MWDSKGIRVQTTLGSVPVMAMPELLSSSGSCSYMLDSSQAQLSGTEIQFIFSFNVQSILFFVTWSYHLFYYFTVVDWYVRIALVYIGYLWIFALLYSIEMLPQKSLHLWECNRLHIWWTYLMEDLQLQFYAISTTWEPTGDPREG